MPLLPYHHLSTTCSQDVALELRAAAEAEAALVVRLEAKEWEMEELRSVVEAGEAAQLRCAELEAELEVSCAWLSLPLSCFFGIRRTNKK